MNTQLPAGPIARPGEAIGILGGGQLGRMLAMAAAEMGLDVHIFTPEIDSPAARVARRTWVAGFDDQVALREFAASIVAATIEFENVPVAASDLIEAEGQLQGGAAQGIGWALNEEYVYGKSGLLENAGFLDYRMPVASDLPMIDTILVEAKPNPRHPYGAKGVGEVPIVPPLAAVGNAVSRIVGRRMSSLPLSPAKVLAAMGK